jgi:sulfotransferase
VQNRLHFISGLPRSGSTLLAALLRQNPRFSSGMSSPTYQLFRTMLAETSARNEGGGFRRQRHPQATSGRRLRRLLP